MSEAGRLLLEAQAGSHEALADGSQPEGFPIKGNEDSMLYHEPGTQHYDQTEAEQLAFEKETLGLYWSGHPVDRYASALKALGARATSELADSPITGPRADAWGPGGPKPIEPDTSIGGIVAACRQLKTRKGDRMAVFTLEDSQGSVEVIAFPETYQRSAALLDTGTMVLVSGKLERDDESVRIIASDIVGIDAVHERLAREVAIRVKMPAARGL